jgi:DNA polymerase-1
MFEDAKILTICAYDGKQAYEDITPEKAQELINESDFVIGANVQYDLSFLGFKHGIRVPDSCTISDILINERLLDTLTKRINLEVLCNRYLGKSKHTDDLQTYADENGIKKYIENLDKFPKEMVVMYCYIDCYYTHKIFMLQYDRLKNHNYWHLENDVQRILFAMKLQGCPFDEEASKTLEKEMDIEIEALGKKLIATYGTTDMNKKLGKEKIKELCENKQLKYNLTATSKPQFNASFFSKYRDIEELGIVKKYNEINKLKKDFVTKLRKLNHKGLLYTSFNPMKVEGSGAVTGRFSSTKPNLQQIPSRNEEWSDKIRNQFKAPEGYSWVKLDYSQQEVRVLLHFAAETGASGTEELRNAYLRDKKTDCYSMAVELCAEQNYTITRPVAKQLILASQYCMGPAKLAVQLNIPESEAKELLLQFGILLPFIKSFKWKVLNSLSAMVDEDTVPHIKTINGRDIHFEVEEGKREVKIGDKVIGYKPYKQAVKAYKGINYTIQGSSADMTKKAMVDIYKELRIVPVLQVHDELDYLIRSEDVDKTVPILISKMENAFDTLVPMVVDVTIGNGWGYDEEKGN